MLPDQTDTPADGKLKRGDVNMVVNGHMLHTRRGLLCISDYFEKLIRSNRDAKTVNLKIIRNSQSLGTSLAVANLKILRRMYRHEPQGFAWPSISLPQPYRA